MQVVVRPTREEAIRIVARIVARSLRAKPDLVLGLATGLTMERLYAILAELHRAEGLDFSRVTTFNLDEYVGLRPEDEGSYHTYMDRHLFSRVNVDRSRTHLLDGTAADLKAECARYESLIARCGGIDVQLLGIGRDGHIGFNEPLSSLTSRTRDKSLTPTTIKQNERFFKDPSRMPRRALTMGVGTILECRRLLMLVTGESKAHVLARSVEGPITSMMSATAIQMHPDVTVLADEEAGARLTAREYYRWIFESEPEWEEFR